MLSRLLLISICCAYAYKEEGYYDDGRNFKTFDPYRQFGEEFEFGAKLGRDKKRRQVPHSSQQQHPQFFPTVPSFSHKEPDPYYDYPDHRYKTPAPTYDHPKPVPAYDHPKPAPKPFGYEPIEFPHAKVSPYDPHPVVSPAYSKPHKPVYQRNPYTPAHPKPYPTKEKYGPYDPAYPSHPDYAPFPETRFDCHSTPIQPGIYADLETNCQGYHICNDGRDGKGGAGFWCPNGTLFNQAELACDHYYKVDCSIAPKLYEYNLDPYKNPYIPTPEEKAAKEARLAESAKHAGYGHPSPKPYHPKPYHPKPHHPKPHAGYSKPKSHYGGYDHPSLYDEPRGFYEQPRHGPNHFPKHEDEGFFSHHESPLINFPKHLTSHVPDTHYG